jgi:hypothetical protein
MFFICICNIEGRPFVVAPLSLCILRLFFHPRDFRFHGFDQIGELFLFFRVTEKSGGLRPTAENRFVCFLRMKNTTRFLGFE